MKKLVSFFEIPATDLNRAIKFYEKMFGIKMQTFDCEREKMAFFPEEDGICPGAISWSSEMSFLPSKDGVLLSLNCEDINEALKTMAENGGTVVIPKTKIEAENRGYFAVFIDCEGNRMGLYSDK